jgi:hypothetical protein
MRAKLVTMILAAAVGVPAAGFLVSPSTAAPTTTSTTVAAAPETTVAPTIDQDLVTACTSDGPALAAKESAGRITVIEQAALNALRPICEANGYTLPGTPEQQTAPVIVEQTVIEAAAPPSTQSASSTQTEGEEQHEHESGENDD